MPKVVREDIDNLNAVLTVTLEKKDYEPKFKSELNKYRKQAHMKGFRKGKTPMSVVKKMYGRSVLAEVVNEILQQQLYDFLRAEDLNILGQPLPSEEQGPVNFDLKDLDDYVFRFDLGLAPEFEVEGISESHTYEKIEVEATEEMIDQEMESARKRLGEQKPVEDTIKENDIVKFSAKELEDGEVKEDGIESEFSILLKSITGEEAKEKLLASKKGDILKLDIFKLEDDKEEDYVRKYYLNLPEDDERETGREYELEIIEVNRLEPAEVNQEFFDNFFGEGEVSSEEEAREKIREQIENFYSSQSEALLFRDIQEGLMEKNEMQFPEDFLKRWMKASNEDVDMEIIEREFDSFAKNLKWSLIRSKLVKRFDIKVEQEEVLENLRNRIRNYFGGGVAPGMEQVVESTAMRLMQDEKQVEQAFEEVLTNKLYEVLAEEVTIEPKKVSLEEFEEEVSKARAAAAAREAAALEEEE